MKRLLAGLLCVMGSLAGAAVELAHGNILVNGDFETGLTGWTALDQTGSDGTFGLQSGTTSPLSASAVPPPPEGLFAAMSDAQGPGSHVLYQDFIVPSAVPIAALSFQLLVNNQGDDFHTPAHLDFATVDLNQQARVDILLASADPFSVAPGDVLAALYQTQPGDPLVAGYSEHSFDLTALVNSNLNVPLRLRFAETDNVFFFQLGVDDVRLQTEAQPVPEPASWWLTITAGAALAWRGRFRRR
jgi:hypothetical protein